MRGLHSTVIITNLSVTGVSDSVTWGQQDRFCWEIFSTLNLAFASLSHLTYLHRTACTTPIMKGRAVSIEAIPEFLRLFERFVLRHDFVHVSFFLDSEIWYLLRAHQILYSE